MFKLLSSLFLAGAILFSSIASAVPLISMETFPNGLVKHPLWCEANDQQIPYTPVPPHVLRSLGIVLAGAIKVHGVPVVIFDYENLPKVPPEYQHLVLLHECKHINHGDLEVYENAPYEPSNPVLMALISSQLETLEYAADCGAAKQLIDEGGFTEVQFDIILSAMNDSELYNDVAGLQNVAGFTGIESYGFDHRINHLKACLSQ